MHDLDLTKRLWTKARGNVIAIGTWIRQERDFQPCLVLLRADKELSDGLVPCVVPLASAWIWSEDVGDPRLAATYAVQFARFLGLTEDQRSAIFVASFIHDMLGDLLSIPPYPQSELKSLAEAVLFDNTTGKVIAETELRES